MLPHEIRFPEPGAKSTADELTTNVVPFGSSTPLANVDSGAARPRELWQIERDAIETTIQQCGGSIPQAARLLGVSPSTIYRKKESWLVSA